MRKKVACVEKIQQVAKINNMKQTGAECLLLRWMTLFQNKALHSCPFYHSCLHKQAMHTAVRMLVHPLQDVHNERKVAAVYIKVQRIKCCMEEFNNIGLHGYSQKEAASATAGSAWDLFPFKGEVIKLRELFHHSVQEITAQKPMISICP